MLAVEESANDDETPVSYWTDVRPIFQANCQGCHQPAKDSGEYVMTAFDSLIAGGETGEAAIVAGDPDASYLIGQIVPVDGKAEMPEGKPPLNDVEIATVVRWVKEGAKNDTPVSASQLFDQDNPPTANRLPSAENCIAVNTGGAEYCGGLS